MAMPKALLCLLDDRAQSESAEEIQLRGAGFATATIEWGELTGQPNGWTQLAEILQTPGLCAWVFVGRPESFTTELVSQTALVSLSLNQENPLSMAFILKTDDLHDVERLKAMLPPLLTQVKVFRKDEPFASRLMAARFKQPQWPDMPFYLRSHLSPLTGVWLEAGPDKGEEWPGFFLAAVGAEIDSLGIGPRGQLPKKCTLEFPMMNIEGNLNGQQWNGCAAKNGLDGTTSAFIRLNRPLDKLIMSEYPADDDNDESTATVLSFN
ncbi:hypothetical protein C4J81_14595 [Deltaproteobacteria bacterium Smac51]|nr:hypothetical protein C4J81_14595 [Deltaproteobacteria bacterium Smac51]